MMPNWTEVIRSLNGVWLLARRDVGGYAYFNQTIEGFWRSFAAVLFIAPVYFVLSGAALELQPADQSTGEATRDVGSYYFGTGVALILDWISFPIIVIFIARGFGLARNYVRFIIAYNWSSVLVFVVANVPAVFFYLGLTGIQTTGGMALIFLIPVIYFRWFVARTALETTNLIAGALVLLEFTLSIGISQYADQIFR